MTEAAPGDVVTKATASEVAPGARGSRWEDYAVVAALSLLAGVTTLFGVFLLPTHLGVTPFPWVVAPVAGVLFWAVNACHRLTDSMWAAAAPLVIFLITCVWMSQSVVLGYVTMLPDWRGKALLYVGTIAGLIAMAMAWAAQVARRYPVATAPAATSPTHPGFTPDQ